MPANLSIKTRWEIVFFHQHLGMSEPAIARQIGCNQSAVSRLLAKYKLTGDVVNLQRTGRKRFLNLSSYEHDQNPIVQAVKAGNYTWNSIE